MKKTTLIFLVSLCIFLGGCVLTAGCIAMGGPTHFIWTPTGVKSVRSWPGSFSQWLDQFIQSHRAADQIEDAVDRIGEAADRAGEAVDRALGTGSWMGNGNFDWDLDGEEDWYDPSRHTSGSEETEAFSAIEADLVCADLVLVESDCWQVSYILPKERDLEFLQVENGVLRLRQKEARAFSFYTGNYRSRIVVSYPKGSSLERIRAASVSGDLNIDRASVKEIDFQATSGDFTAKETAALESCEITTTSGDGELSGQTGLKRFRMETTSGDLSLESVVFSGETFEFSSTSGDLDLVECRLDNTQPVRISTTSGDFLLKGVWANAVNLESTSGDMEGEGLKCGEMNLSSTSGRIDLSGTLNSVSFATISGDIRLKTTLRESQYRYALSSGGRIQVNGGRKERKFEQGGSPYFIQGTSKSGMIEIQTEK